MNPVRMLVLLLSLTCTPFAAYAGADNFTFNGFGTLGVSRLGGEDPGRSYGIQGQVNDRWRGDELSRLGGQFSYSTAIGLFNSVVNLAVLLLVNRIAKKRSEVSLW